MYQNRWGGIKQVHVPNAVFENKSLILNPDSIAFLLTLLHIYKYKAVKDSQPIATVRVGQGRLTERTGYSRNVITKAAKALEKAGFIRTVPNRKKYQEFGTNEYFLCHPKTHEPLVATGSLLYRNGIPYFAFPACVIKEQEANWSLANMTGSELSLYVGILWLANSHRTNEFNSTALELRSAARLSSPTFKKVLNGLEERGLVWVTNAQDEINVKICDPYTAEPLQMPEADEDDPANYYAVAENGSEKRLNLNTGDPEQVEKLIRSCLPDDEVAIVQGNGDLMIRCPFHSDDNPSCSVSPTKNGCFHCFGCEESGSLRKLVMQLKSFSTAEAVQHMGQSLGVQVTYRDPVANAVIYEYRDAKEKLQKQVLRYPNDENGKKVILQRRPDKGGWVWNVAGLPPMLFNMELLEYAGVVCITEGEKDAKNVTELRLMGDSGLLIGMTSGGADSWDAHLAQHLRGKKVVVMPDDDPAGERFRADVTSSLDAEHIEYRVRTFGDVGAKDVTDFLEEHSVEDLVRRMGSDWVRMPDGRRLQDELPELELEPGLAGEIIP